MVYQKGLINQLNRFCVALWPHSSKIGMKFSVKHSLHIILQCTEHMVNLYLVLCMGLSPSCLWIVELVWSAKYILQPSQYKHTITFKKRSLIISRQQVRLCHIKQITTKIMQHLFVISRYPSVVQTQLYLKASLISWHQSGLDHTKLPSKSVQLPSKSTCLSVSEDFTMSSTHLS